MRLSHSTLTLLDQLGDENAHIVLVAWGGICGILWETQHLQVHYRARSDYLVMHVRLPYEEQHVFVPYRWHSKPEALTLEHPIIEDTSWYQKAR